MGEAGENGFISEVVHEELRVFSRVVKAFCGTTAHADVCTRVLFSSTAVFEAWALGCSSLGKGDSRTRIRLLGSFPSTFPRLSPVLMLSISTVPPLPDFPQGSRV